MKKFDTVEKFIFVFAALVLSTGTSFSQDYRMAGNLRPYPYTEEAPKQTAPPDGYVPFHLEHYGRHGSRWLLGDDDYRVPVANLEKAERAGKLTPLGVKTLEALRQAQAESVGHLGELTSKGAVQHRAIGRRMAQNYPEIFNDSAVVDAKSTIVIRCIISMGNALQGIGELVPNLKVTKDASQADMWFMNFDDKPAWALKDSVNAGVMPKFIESLDISDSYLDRLVNDPDFARDSVAPGLMPRFYWVMANAGSHEGQEWLLEDIFPSADLKKQQMVGNAGWFIHGGHTPLTGGRMPFTQRNLLKQIIEQTDAAIESGQHGANLRFGHDGILLPLISLMNIGGFGNRIDSLEELETKGWHDYDLIPMAGNLQLVFYKKPNGSNDDILVKAMLNETEMSLPGTPVAGNYYSWKDLKKYYNDRLAAFETWGNQQ